MFLIKSACFWIDITAGWDCVHLIPARRTTSNRVFNTRYDRVSASPKITCNNPEDTAVMLAICRFLIQVTKKVYYIKIYDKQQCAQQRPLQQASVVVSSTTEQYKT